MNIRSLDAHTNLFNVDLIVQSTVANLFDYFFDGIAFLVFDVPPDFLVADEQTDTLAKASDDGVVQRGFAAVAQTVDV